MNADPPTDERSAYECYRRGHELLASHDFNQATVPLERARRLEPDKGSIREALGRAYISCRRYAEAATEFAVAVELAPTDGYAHYGLARALDRLGDRHRAARHYKLARVYGSPIS